MRILLHKMAPKRKREQSLERKIKRPATNTDATPNSVFVSLMHDMSSRQQLESENSADYNLLYTIGELDTTSPLQVPLLSGRGRYLWGTFRGGVNHAARLHAKNLEDLDMQLEGRSESFRRERLHRLFPTETWVGRSEPAPEEMLVLAQPLRTSEDGDRLTPLVLPPSTSAGSSAESINAKQRRLHGKYH